MASPSNQRPTAYDPFGEPMALPRACTGAAASGATGSYRETRRAALVFWALVVLFVGGRAYLSDPSATHAAVAEAAPAAVQVTSLR